MQTNIEKKITKFIKKIEDECKEFIKYEETFGNQCAYTDRMVENIIEFAGKLEKPHKIIKQIMEFAKELENSYNELFKSFDDEIK